MEKIYEKDTAGVRPYTSINKEWLIDELDDIVYISDIETYELIYLNKIGRNRCKINDYMGHKCYELLQNRTTPCPFCTNSKLTCDRFYTWEYTNPTLNRKFLVKDKLVNWNDKNVRMEIAVDVTYENTSHLSEISLERAILDCLKTLSEKPSLEEAINDVLRIIVDFFQGERSYIVEIDSDKAIARNTYEYCQKGVISQMPSLQEVPFDAIPLMFETFEKKENLIISQIEELKNTYPDEYKFLKIRNAKNLLAVPFVGKHTFSGYVGVDNPKKNIEYISMLDTIALSISNEIKRRRLYERAEYNSTHDELSNLLNRYSYTKYIEETSKKEVQNLGILLADINGLKLVNQEYGQQRGNAQIQSVASILKKHFINQQIFRLSGDEFVVICENMIYEHFLSKVKLVEEECKLVIHHGISIGYTWDDKEMDIHKMMKNAEELLIINKQIYYQHSDIDTKRFSSTRLQELKKEIANRCFKIMLQPKVNAVTGAIHSAEALVRYHHPQFGMISPNRFIPAFEKERLIRYIDFEVLDQVCAILQEWKKSGKELIPISVNFSRVTLLEEDFLQMLMNIKEKYDFSCEYICIEVTETVGVMERKTINALSSLITKAGFKISLDDFGSNYASLSMLPAMDFNELKLDKSLIDNLTEDHPSQIIIKCIIDMCKSLDIETVAEGVETYEQFKLLQDYGCDIIQGYYFSKPITQKEFEGLSTFHI